MPCTVYHTVAQVGMSKKNITQTVTFVLAQLGELEAEVSVHCIGDARMRTLNRQYRGKDKTTDVLSFSTQDTAVVQLGHDRGDIFISVPQIRRQAKEYGVPYREEFTRMLIHGILHLFGYDHVKKNEAKKMFDLQERFVTKTLV